MRRKEKEIVNQAQIDAIINSCDVCRLGLSKDNRPYVIPISFGYDGQNIYFHTALVGQKLEYLAANAQVCVEFERQVQIIPHATSPCSWSAAFQSVICFGAAEEITAPEKMLAALNTIMRHYSGREWEIPPEQLSVLRTWRIKISTWHGKQTRKQVCE
ncbi:MAG: pyridoxamine 5'-phosphate oxidase family protein [Chloroflexota bacterium]|nr:pyridoxamine 5'-phosphate oxidase family protein [Chloroflexota bacterium]